MDTLLITTSMPKNKKPFGMHYIIELAGCDSKKLKYLATVEKVFMEAARRSKATIIDHFFHQFSPFGVSGLISISESHFTIHTWPEAGYAAIDIFSCSNKMNIELAISIMEKKFSAKKVKIKKIIRGT